MKRYLSIFAIAALSCSMLAACSDDEDYIPGQPEDPDCYGVYFPEHQTSIELDPAESTDLTFTAARTKTTDAITVPVSIKRGGETFSVSEIEFAAGEAQTTFTVSFPDAEVGVTYDFDMVIEDSRYASIYGLNDSGFYFNVTRVKWNVLGTGAWTYNVAYSGTESGLILEQRDGTNIFRIPNWNGGTTLLFQITANGTVVNTQYIGDDYPGYGQIWIKSTQYGDFDEETSTFTFVVNYYIYGTSLGFGSGIETFTITDPAE